MKYCSFETLFLFLSVMFTCVNVTVLFLFLNKILFYTAFAWEPYNETLKVLNVKNHSQVTFNMNKLLLSLFYFIFLHFTKHFVMSDDFFFKHSNFLHLYFAY